MIPTDDVARQLADAIDEKGFIRKGHGPIVRAFLLNDLPLILTRIRALEAEAERAGSQITLSAEEAHMLLHVLNDDALSTFAFVEEGHIYNVLYYTRAKIQNALAADPACETREGE